MKTDINLLTHQQKNRKYAKGSLTLGCCVYPLTLQGKRLVAEDPDLLWMT